MCKQHLNSFAIAARAIECFGLGQRRGYVTLAEDDTERYLSLCAAPGLIRKQQSMNVKPEKSAVMVNFSHL